MPPNEQMIARESVAPLKCPQGQCTPHRSCIEMRAQQKMHIILRCLITVHLHACSLHSAAITTLLPSLPCSCMVGSVIRSESWKFSAATTISWKNKRLKSYWYKHVWLHQGRCWSHGPCMNSNDCALVWSMVGRSSAWSLPPSMALICSPTKDADICMSGVES